MATVVVLADPAREGLVLPDVPEATPLSVSDATDLYAAFLRDAVAAGEASGGDLLVNYRSDDLLPERFRRDVDPESAIRASVDRALADPEDVRFERQVGSTRSARVGNTVTHLLREEDAPGVVVVDPRAPMLDRVGIDQIAMELRRSDVVVAPSTRGRVAAIGFAETLDFEDALEPPALARLTERARADDLQVEFRPVQPLVETGADLATVLSLVRARETADRKRPAFTARALGELELQRAATEGGASVLGGTDSS